MLDIVVPMAGAGRRFASAGYKVPKPLIPVHGVPMIRLVINNLRPSLPHRFIFICQDAHVQAHDLRERMKDWALGSEMVTIDGFTEGAACTVLAAREHIDSERPLVLANSDQYIDADIDIYLREMADRDLDGLVMTMQASDPKWSFVDCGRDGLVRRVTEKRVISDTATVGIYGFRRGCDFVCAAEKMIDADDRTNNEFYIAPVYNYLIGAGARIGTYNIGAAGNGMYGLGTPDDINDFLARPVSRQAVAGIA